MAKKKSGNQLLKDNKSREDQHEAGPQAVPSLRELIGRGDRAYEQFQHESAIEAYTQALTGAYGEPDSAQRFHILCRRADSFRACGQMHGVIEDTLGLAQAASATRRPQAVAEAALRRAEVSELTGDSEAIMAYTQEVIDAARAREDLAAEAKALAALGVVYERQEEWSKAEELLQQALNLYVSLDEPADRIRCQLWLAMARRGDKTRAAHELLDAAIQASRVIGDRRLEALASSIITMTATDLAERRSRAEVAVRLAQDLDLREFQARLNNHLCLVYIQAGLYDTALGYGELAVSKARAGLSQHHLSAFLESYARVLFAVGKFEEAGQAFHESLALAEELKLRSFEGYAALGLGRLHLARSDLEAAEPLLRRAVELFQDVGASAELGAALSSLARVSMANGEWQAALDLSREAVRMLESVDEISVDLPPQEVWWTYHEILASAPKRRKYLDPSDHSLGTIEGEAVRALDRAKTLADAGIASVTDEGLRRNYWNKVEVNRDILLAWVRLTGAESAGREAQTPADPQQQFQRMLSIGVRMNERRDPDELLEFVMDQLVELSGAEHAALILAEPDAQPESGAQRGFGTDPDPVTLAAPLVDNVARTFRPALWQKVSDADISTSATSKLDSLSALCVPLLSRGRIVGWLYADNHTVFGAFTQADVDLISAFANQVASALENARLYQGLEQRVAERTAELERANLALEDRAGELSIINSVQAGLASKLDFDSIIELVGEKIAEIFQADVVGIGLYDSRQDLVHYPYVMDHGERYFPEPVSNERFIGRLKEFSEPILVDTGAELEDVMAEWGAHNIGGPTPDNSHIIVPIRTGDQLIGSISIARLPAYAFSQAHVRLLQTLANSMSVALENARLFDEANQLLEETRQRAAELSIINDVGQALVKKLEFDAVLELIGDRVREIFQADTMYILLYDAETQVGQMAYYIDRDQRHYVPPAKPGKGLSSIILTSQQPLLLGTIEEANELGSVRIAAEGEEDRNESFLGVPFFSGDQVAGVISVQSYQRHAYDESHLRLLSTLASSMSVALENARLFDETQRLLQVTAERAAELATVNAVGQALVAETDLEALIQLTGEQIRSTFSADIVYVALLDEQSKVIHFPYAHGEEFAPLALGEGLTSQIIESGEPLLINEQMDKRRAEMGISLVGKRARSFLGVPIQVGQKVFGVISVQSTQQEGRFDEGDLRLLGTIAANVGTAIRNAQLFAEIKRQKQYYEAIIETSPTAIALIDQAANVTGWNPAAERLFGYTEAEALGRNIDDLVARTEELHAEAMHYSEKGIREKQLHVLAKRTHKDGSLVDVEISVVPVVVDGTEENFIAIYHDITELQQARLAAEKANQAKSAFLANMSHELRTPLNAIIGFTRIVRRKGQDLLPEKQIENLEKVLVSAEHLLGLINAVLDISKIEAGRMEVEAATFNLPHLVDLVIATTQPLVQDGVDLEAIVPSELSGVYSDQEKVKQILINLLSNAAKFTKAGKITLRARAEAGMLRLKVQDTGIGIPPEALEKVFEEFQQADVSTTREYGGTGLGLSISRSLARLLGGDLTASSVEGEGSTFSLSIPLRYGEQPVPEGPGPAQVEEMRPPSGLPLVLSIDDDSNVHDLLRENLGEHGYEVLGTRSGDEGLRLARELAPFAITLDIMMPRKDGWQVLHELKSDAATRDIPVIMVTIVDKQSLGYQLGAADYLVKPLEEDAVLAALERLRARKQVDPKARLLVVDDDPNIADMVRQLLADAPYSIDTAEDGEAALEAISRQAPDIILLDLLMPRMDGLALIEILREQAVHIPIIVLTAKTLTSVDLEILEDSVARVIQKNGLDQERLLAELRRTMDEVRRTKDEGLSRINKDEG